MSGESSPQPILTAPPQLWTQLAGMIHPVLLDNRFVKPQEEAQTRRAYRLGD